jgi:plastocyanin
MKQINLNNEPAPAAPVSQRRWHHHPATWAVISAVFFGLILAASLANRHQSKPKAPISSAMVSITASGFVPHTIFVKPGTRVSWINQDAKAHELAADPYPRNDSIPNFNNELMLQTNDAYSFVFSKTGTYHYHDQLNPFKFTGTVMVD